MQKLNALKFFYLFWLVFPFMGNAKVILPGIFTDNMVLQQKKSVPIWGTSSAQQVIVTTSWDKKKIYGNSRSSKQMAGKY